MGGSTKKISPEKLQQRKKYAEKEIRKFLKKHQGELTKLALLSNGGLILNTDYIGDGPMNWHATYAANPDSERSLCLLNRFILIANRMTPENLEEMLDYFFNCIQPISEGDRHELD